jgi:glutamyl-tRNA synthetase
MAEIFEVERVGKNPARFDMKKLESINAEKIRGLTIEELTQRAIPFVERAGIAIESGTDSKARKNLLAKAMPLIQERIVTLEEVPQYVRFLFVDQISIDPDSAAKILTPDAMPILAAAEKALIELTEWTVSAIEETMRTVLLDQMGLKPKMAFSPVRVAVTGDRISPPLFESMELLGRDRSLARIKAARTL